MEPDTTEATAEQLITDLVVAHLDAHPELVAQATALGTQVTNQLSPTPPPSDGGEDLFGQLEAHVLATLNIDSLTREQRTVLTQLAAKPGQTFQNALNDRRFAFDMTAWQRAAATQQAKAARAQGPSLVQTAKLSEIAVFQGEVSMGDTDLSSGGKKILWTSAIGGCVGLAIRSGTQIFLTHLKPDQLKPHHIAPFVVGTGNRIPLGGASFWLSSPSSAGAPYYQQLRQELINAGAVLQAEFGADTLAIRHHDGAVFHDFPPPQM